MDKKQVFYGASVTSRSQEQAKDIIRRARRITEFFDKHGYQCLSDVVLDADMHAKSVDRVKGIPEQFVHLSSQELLDKLAVLRLSSKNQLADELACHHWGLAALKQASFCVWDLTLPSTGAGFELATALAMNKRCFCFSEGSRVSSTISGCPSSLLTVAVYDNTIEQNLLDFLAS